MKFGETVKAYPLDGSGPVVGAYKEPSLNEGKDWIQVGAEAHELAYREPQDYDEAGPNGTYCAA
jgi:hypothetical protein